MERTIIAFLGAGNMATAIIAGLVGSGYPPNCLIAVNRSAEKNRQLKEAFGVESSCDAASSASRAEVVVLGVEPQQMRDLLSTVRQAVNLSTKLVVSIAAGLSCDTLAEMALCPLNVIRVMPNTPSCVREGMSGMFASEGVSEGEKRFTEKLFETVGKVHWVREEADINKVIAVAGSAPAYFFLFMEAMQTEATRMGMDPKAARDMVQQAAFGASKMVVENRETSLATLREQVTSRGGTTAEAVATFRDRKLAEIVSEAMRAAKKRAEEMEAEL